MNEIEVVKIETVGELKLVTFKYGDALVNSHVKSEDEIEAKKKDILVHLEHRAKILKEREDLIAKRRAEKDQEIELRPSPVSSVPAGTTVVTPRKSCCGSTKTIGLKSLVVARLSGPAPFLTTMERFQICQGCQEVDSKGERLYRILNENPYCGLPRLQDVLRDEALDGCGCNLGEKVRFKKSACPKGKWGFVS